MRRWKHIATQLRRWLLPFNASQQAAFMDSAEAELREMQHIFGLLVMGQAVGLPAPPAHITLELLPELEDELVLLIDHIDTAQAPFSHLYSTFPVD